MSSPEPLYRSDRAAVYCADARDVMPLIATESVDLIVTDPPYGVEWQSNTRAEAFAPIENDGADDRGVVAEVLRECVRVVDQAHHLYVFGPTDVLDGLKVAAPTTLIWAKGTMGSGDLSAAWGPAHEPISFTVSKHRHAGQTGKPALPVRRRKGTVLSFNRQTGRKVRHPTEKPVGLLMELVESSSRIGEIVLDPFAGIGSTGVAAILRGRSCVLVELDPTYAALAVERVKHAEQVADDMGTV